MGLRWLEEVKLAFNTSTYISDCLNLLEFVVDLIDFILVPVFELQVMDGALVFVKLQVFILVRCI